MKHIPIRLLRVFTVLGLLGSTAAASETSFEDNFERDHSANYEIQGGKWAYDAENRCFTMAKAREEPNETMWALRRDVALPRAFAIEAEYIANGKDSSAAIVLKNPATGDHAVASLALNKATEGGWWVTAWIVYSYADEKWGYLHTAKKLVPNLVDPNFSLRMIRPPGSNNLEFIVFNSDFGALETWLSPDTRGADGKRLSPAWVGTLDSLSRVGFWGYDSQGAWSAIKLTDLTGNEPAPAAGDITAKPFRYSFEDAAELSDWQCQPGITTAQSNRWASDGNTALQIHVPPGTPWFGVQREVKLDEFRRHEFLEFDLHAVTEVDYAGFRLHAEKFQELLANHDRLKPGESVSVRLRLADNDIVRFGETAALSIWLANNTPAEQIILVDNIRLTGFGGEAAELDRLRARIKAANITNPATIALLADCAAKLDGEVTAADVAALKDRWSTILAGELEEGAKFHAVVASPLDKIKRNASLADLPVEPAERGVRLEVARNEYETRQLVFLPKNRQGEVALELSAEDLKGPQGAVIPAADIELRLVDEVDISGTTQFPGEKLTGHWPDPLVPNAPFTIKGGRLQCVWLTVKAGATAAPGEYQGRLAIRESGGKEVSLPLTVNVWDFALPEKSSLKSLFGAWSHNWATFYNYAKIDFGAWLTPPTFDSIPKDRQLDAIRFFARYRATLQGMNTWGLMFGKVVAPVLQPDGSMSLTKAPSPDLPTYDEVAVAAMQNDGALTIAEIGGHTKLHEGAEAKDTAFIARTTEYLQMVERHAEEKGWEGPLYCYMWDEPHLKPNGWSAVLKESRLVKTVAPKIKTLVASGVFSPTPKQARFYKDIDAFVLLWDRTPQRDVQHLRKIGKEMWWYPANVTDAPYPNWAVNNNNFAARIIPLMSYKFQMDGMLQWAATLFADVNSFPQDGPRWPERPWSMKDWPYRPGEAHVVYPAPDQSFWPSIRLSNWRDGMEDYEYLKLLEKALPGLPEEKQTRGRELLSLAALVTAPYDYSHQPADFSALRREVAALLARN